MRREARGEEGGNGRRFHVSGRESRHHSANLVKPARRVPVQHVAPPAPTGLSAVVGNVDLAPCEEANAPDHHPGIGANGCNTEVLVHSVGNDGTRRRRGSRAHPFPVEVGAADHCQRDDLLQIVGKFSMHFRGVYYQTPPAKGKMNENASRRD